LSLKAKFFSLTFALHFALLLGAYFVIEEDRILFVIVELFLLVSLFLFLKLIKSVLAPFEFVDLFSDVLHEQEYTTRFSHTGNIELDNLMTLFNQMLDQLYDERLKLGDRKGMLQQLMDAIPLSILVFDYNNRISHLNPKAESLLGTELVDAKNRYLASFDHSLTKQLVDLSSGHSILLSDSAGNRFQCYRNAFRDRGFDRHFIIIQELTQELKSSEKSAYEKLIRMMSHEVNNTMAATGSLLKSCLNYSDQIAKNERNEYENAMHLVIERTDNLSQFMQEYAQLVRLPVPVLENCNLVHILLSVQKLFESSLEDNQTRLTISKIDPMVTQFTADKKQLEQVLINVVKNAIEAIGQGGEIEARISLSEKCLILQIDDTGKGIQSDEQRQLFTPFFTSKAEGQGIGLMLVREILDAHQFDFSLANRSEAGARFEIRFNHLK